MLHAQYKHTFCVHLQLNLIIFFLRKQYAHLRRVPLRNDVFHNLSSSALLLVFLNQWF